MSENISRDNLQGDLDKVLVAVRNLAINSSDSQMRISHTVFAIVVQPNIVNGLIIDELQENVDDLVRELKAHYETETDKLYNKGDNIMYVPELVGLITSMVGVLNKGELLSVEDFFIKLIEIDDPVIPILTKHIAKDRITDRIKNLRTASNVSMHDEEQDDIMPVKLKKEKSKTPFLDNFGRDLTVLASQGKLDPVYGRDSETERVAQILARRQKNNPILIGEPGIGKTAIAEKLATIIFEKVCPYPLLNKRVVSLDLASIVAGTKYRGQFEERTKKLLDEVRANPDVILFIDEIHMLIGAGNAAGTMDAANIFKPALARGEVQCIGATTTDEYRESIEQDGALERRFQKIIVDEPSFEDTMEIIRILKPRYEDFHKVTYTEDAILEIVRLSDRYITNRFFPDKAIDVMDEAGARCHIGLVPPPILSKLEKELSELREQKQETVLNDDYENAIVIRDTESKLETQLKEETDKWKNEVTKNKKVVTADIIAKVISIMTKIPVDAISKEEKKHLMEIDNTLIKYVKGQNEAIKTVASSIKRNRLGLAKSTKPIGVFLFIGNTGIGKTYLAKMLAKHVFGNEKNLIRFDMSEYSQEFNISRLIGSAPGYVGFEKGGQLTEQVRNNPYSVVLFDEIEKAHPKVYNVLLQLFDEGRLTDEMGKTTNFKNTIIIMTSNVGSQELQQHGNGIGYNAQTLDNKTSHSIIEKAMKNKFKPEFINRIDEIVQFNMLQEDDIKEIIKLQLLELAYRAKENNYNLVVKPKVHQIIFDEGYSTDYGAREIQRTIRKLIENPISDKLLKENVIDNITITVNVKNNKINITLEQPYPVEQLSK